MFLFEKFRGIIRRTDINGSLLRVGDARFGNDRIILLADQIEVRLEFLRSGLFGY